MARPLRRVITQLSIRLGISPREIWQWDMDTIREFIAELTSGKSRLSKASGEKPFLPNPESQEQLEVGLATAFGRFS